MSKVISVMLSVVLVAVPTMAQAGGGLFRRSSVSHCAPVHNKAIVVDQAVAFAQPYVPAAPVTIVNNYPPAPATVQSVYGYSYGGVGAQPLQYNPFQVDPSEILREAARLTDRSQNLAGESLRVYQQLGTDAMSQAGMVAQLQARAALIESSKPVVTQESRTIVTQGFSAERNSQAQTAPSGMICLVPDGQGGYRIVQGGQPQVPQAGNEGLSVLQSRCAACHTGSQSQGGFQLFDDGGQLVSLTQEQKGKILSLTAMGAMPPAQNANGQPIPELTDDELAAVRLFLR